MCGGWGRSGCSVQFAWGKVLSVWGWGSPSSDKEAPPPHPLLPGVNRVVVDLNVSITVKRTTVRVLCLVLRMRVCGSLGSDKKTGLLSISGSGCRGQR